MQDQDFSQYHPGRALAREMERRAESMKSGARQLARAGQNFSLGRKLTENERREIGWMFGPLPGLERARVRSRNLFWPYPNDRAMVPWGSIFFPHQQFVEDFFAPGVDIKLQALFMHEATHLYQWYALGTNVWLVGPTDRTYIYELVKGQPLRDYGLEQMGDIVRDYYYLRHGYRPNGNRYSLADYSDVLPVRR